MDFDPGISRLSLHLLDPLGLKLLLYRPSPLFESEEQLQLQLHKLFPLKALKTYIDHSINGTNPIKFCVLWWSQQRLCGLQIETIALAGWKLKRKKRNSRPYGFKVTPLVHL